MGKKEAVYLLTSASSSAQPTAVKHLPLSCLLTTIVLSFLPHHSPKLELGAGGKTEEEGKKGKTEEKEKKKKEIKKAFSCPCGILASTPAPSGARGLGSTPSMDAYDHTYLYLVWLLCLIAVRQVSKSPSCTAAV